VYTFEMLASLFIRLAWVGVCISFLVLFLYFLWSYWRLGR
jgi:hypothetical protein